jgi:hypothetical protein
MVEANLVRVPARLSSQFLKHERLQELPEHPTILGKGGRPIARFDAGHLQPLARRYPRDQMVKGPFLCTRLRRMRGFSRRITAAGLTLCAAGCSAWNTIDVCDQKSAGPITVNQGFEGIQKTGSPAAIAPLPGGNAMVVFASEVGGRDPAEVTELRSVRLTADGARLPGCEGNDGRDDVLVPAVQTDPGKQLREAGFAAGPVGPNRTGLITYRAQEGDRPPELWGVFFQSNGCPYFGSSDRRKAFLIATVPSGEELVGQSVVALGAGKPDDDFLVLWEELSGDGVFRARARVLRMTPSGPVFLPTVPSREGAAVSLPDVVIPKFLYGMAPVVMGNEIAVAAHYSTGGNDSQLQVWFFDDRLQMVRPTVQVASDGVRGELLPGRDVTAAYDGRTLLVGWIMNDPAGRASLFTRALDPQGRPRAPAFRVRTQADATDNFPVATAWKDHGFLVSWRQQGGQGDRTGPRILGRLLDSSGRPSFTAQACGEQPFVIAQQSDGDRRQASIAPLESNDVLAVWTEDSTHGADTSGSSIQGRVLPVGSLFVGASKPGSGKVPPPPIDAGDPPPPPDGGPGDSAPGAMCEAPQPHTRKGGERCLCNVDCESGAASCGIELPEGFPGGMCIKACNIAMPDSCGPGGVCRGNATDAYCLRACTTHEDCGPGRACSGTPRACMPYCWKDSDCRSGHCDPYRGLCHSEAAPLSGKGALEPCLRHDDCRSRYCSSVNNRCLVSCHAAMPNCPATTICVPFPNGDGGLCLPTCPDGTCFDPALKCNTQAGLAEKVCL